jgi:ligand-binding SRPBCC domain-containing protein
MSEGFFEQSVELPVSAAEVFDWHEQPGALQALTPPWEKVRVQSMSDGIRSGSRVILRARVGPVWTTWEMEHHGYVAGREFNDRMIRGPFSLWEHRHRFEDLPPDGEGRPRSRLTDTIRYRLPFGILGVIAGSLGASAFTRRKLEKMFAYRHAATVRAFNPPHR